MVKFAELLEMVAQVHPDLRIRYSTSHPKDMTDDVLHVIAKYENIYRYPFACSIWLLNDAQENE